MPISPKQAEAKKSPDIGAKPVADASKKWKVNDKYNSEDADVTIVSSDGVAFKVHSYQLQAASSIFRDLLSIAQTPSQRDPIIFTDKVIEQSWVVGSLLDSVYQREVTCLGNRNGTRAVIDLAEKWDFHHVVKLVRFHFRNDKTDQLSGRRLTLAMALNEKEIATESVKTWHTGIWKPSPSVVQEKPVPAFDSIYLHGSPVAELLGERTIDGGKVHELGTSGYRSYLGLSPTTAWALLRARHLATTVPCEVDGAKFKAEFAKLLDIIIPDEVAKPTSE